MTGSPDQNASRLNDFLTAAKGESASLATQKGKPLHPFSIRLTQEERERLEAEAKGKPLSVYMRERLLGDGSTPRKLRRKPAADQAGLAKVLGMLGQSRLANNLNQIAKAAHIGVLVVSPALLEELENARRDIRIMRDALLSALGFPPSGASS
ncbi:MobC family plasmid mobilization relaxosome protein [Gloeobacter morelensis]|uniref:Plasmid mobilization relaxosome protein MobC n=1 Tax=Gloeobacter morelensis MG652769 TaxID=2781736 RepID=A0ABY3PLR1_9CYAN|nr:MobC family plasmid mobilization relaxosome protein [Gloeobacter morelensis]UFP94610.1 plasmid mobilization relaxosome protein MobC [Gloeobacter morelensis MG652769]